MNVQTGLLPGQMKDAMELYNYVVASVIRLCNNYLAFGSLLFLLSNLEQKMHSR